MRRQHHNWACALCLALVAWTSEVEAQQGSSMTPDDAFQRAMTYFQNELGKVRSQLATQNAVDNGASIDFKRQFAEMRKELENLREMFRAKDSDAGVILTAFAEKRGDVAVDAMFVRAAERPQATVDNRSRAEEFKRIGVLAFAIDTGRAVKAYEQALNLAPDDVDAAANLAILYQRLGQQDKALALAERQIASSNPLAQAHGHIRKGDITRIRGDLSGALLEYNTALKIAENANIKERQAAAFSGIGSAEFIRGDLVKADAAQQQSLAIAAGIGDDGAQAKALANLGASAYMRSKLAEADAYSRQSLALNLKLERKDGQARDYSNLGLIALDRKDYAGAETLQKKALEIDTELGAKEGQAKDLGNLGNIAYLRGDYPSAEAYLNRALALNAELGRTEGEAKNHSTLGNIAFMKKALDLAESHQQRALSINLELNSTTGQAYALNSLGDIHVQKRDIRGACDFYRRSLDLSLKMDAAGGIIANAARDNIARYCAR